MFKEQERSEGGEPPMRTEYTEEEKKLFHELEAQLDDLVTPYCAESKNYGRFRATARRNVIFLPKDPSKPVLQSIDLTRWEYYWEDRDRSTKVVGVGYDIDKQQFYVSSNSGEDRFLSTVAEAVAEIRKQLDVMCAYFEEKK
ncbi:hypothetical protein HY625_02625 [Candidatus Uhrbacteria bacterium]|nr:hypothetical protein [Candidatus Uhrbacteria bacterium]